MPTPGQSPDSPPASTTLVTVTAVLTGKSAQTNAALLRSQTMACSFEGTWKEGDFATGDWVLRDGTTYKGTFQGGKPLVRSCTAMWQLLSLSPTSSRPRLLWPATLYLTSDANRRVTERTYSSTATSSAATGR